MAVVAMDPQKVYECTVKGKADGQWINNVWHWELSNAVVTPSGDIQVFANNLRDYWRAEILACLSVSYQLWEVIVKEIIYWQLVSGVKRVIYNNTAVAPAATATDFGAITGDYLPTYNSFTVQKKTTFAGRRYRGSVRFATIGESDTTGNQMTTTANSRMQTALDKLLVPATAVRADAGGTIETYPVVFSKTGWFLDTGAAGPTPTVQPAAYGYYVFNFLENVYLGSQVSRKKPN